jgi:hypothetical protein
MTPAPHPERPSLFSTLPHNLSVIIINLLSDILLKYPLKLPSSPLSWLKLFRQLTDQCGREYEMEQNN